MQGLPGLKDSANVLRPATSTKFSLGDTAAVLPKRPVDLLYGLFLRFDRFVNLQMLPVNLAPKCVLSPERSQLVNVDVKDVSVDSIQT